MGKFSTEGSKFIYSDEVKTVVLLDLDDYYSNHGRIPFHSDMTENTIPNLITKCLDNHQVFCKKDPIR